MVPWSPLAFSLLAGKYDRAAVERAGPRAGGLPRDAADPGETRPADDKRLDGANPFGDALFTERNWAIVDMVKRIAGETGHSPAKIALSWVAKRPDVTSTLLGVSRAGQLADNLAALDVVLSPEHRTALEAVSAPNDPRMLYSLFTPAMRQNAAFGGSAVEPWRA